MATDKGDQFEDGGSLPTVFPDGTCPTDGGESMARSVDNAAQETMDPEFINCPESDNEGSLRQTVPQKRPRSTSTDSETYDDDEFMANLDTRLHEEARYQEGLEDYTAWARGRNGLVCLSLAFLFILLHIHRYDRSRWVKISFSEVLLKCLCLLIYENCERKGIIKISMV